MMKQMKRTVYEAPVTERFQVELEGVFCASADIQNPNEANGRIEAHGVNTDWGTEGNGYTFDVSSSWD